MDAVIENLPAILDAFWLTIKLTAISAVISLILGIVLVAMRVSPLPVLRAVGTAYVNGVRNSPLTLIMLFSGLGLGTVMSLKFSDDLSVQDFWLAIIALSLYHASFVCEALRSGINTVPMGQAEAARAIGLTFMQNLRLIILPQALRAVIAPLGSILIALTKNTTVAAAIGVGETALLMKNLFELEGDSVIPIFIGFAIGFLILTLPTGLFFGWLAKRLAVVR
ncbi:amino acid ABC transporter permease [Bailinhaonella thermotolerans]|uniref:Amino acid ABC transporter permease n=1 Tax=Bailinhaonella thermotolerans TaxID=1070861 RepID=A0A3A4AY59_9ACTN|nr:amino acid ABC transporter permease [Bailinhaonella thermotolerans]RJL26528.1 amino acid ABC transporter permease [Bailinhaonella thermotolerans]